MKLLIVRYPGSNQWMNTVALAVVIMALLILTGCGGGDDPDPAVGGITVESITPTGTFEGDDGLSIDSKGSLYVSHLASGSGTTLYKVSPDGTSSVFGSNLSAPMGHAFDVSDNLYVSNDNSTTITIIDPQGQASDYLSDPEIQGGGLLVDSDGTLFHTVYSTNRVLKISPEKEITVLASGAPLNVPLGITMDENKNLYLANFSDGVVSKVTPSGELTKLATVPSQVGYIAYANGQLYATGFSTHIIYTISLEGTVAVLAGTGQLGTIDGSAEEASFAAPNGIAASADGKTIYISQKNFTIRKINLE